MVSKVLHVGGGWLVVAVELYGLVGVLTHGLEQPRDVYGLFGGVNGGICFGLVCGLSEQGLAVRSPVEGGVVVVEVVVGGTAVVVVVVAVVGGEVGVCVSECC